MKEVFWPFNAPFVSTKLLFFNVCVKVYKSFQTSWWVCEGQKGFCWKGKARPLATSQSYTKP